MANGVILSFFAAAASLAAADFPMACTPEEPVVTSDEQIQVTAWVSGSGWKYEWSVDAGRVSSEGRNALWDFAGATLGAHVITVKAIGPVEMLTCTAVVQVENSARIRGELVTRRFLLDPGRPERKGYALYSYVLLPLDGQDDAARERNRKLIEAWYNRIAAIAALERSKIVSVLNATYVPVTAPVPEKFDAAWVLAHYDYGRADIWRARLNGSHPRGPYLVSSRVPLSGRAEGPFLILDVSWAPAKTANFWLDAFVNQAAQERFDRPAALQTFELKLRTMISVLAEGLPKAREALAAIVELAK